MTSQSQPVLGQSAQTEGDAKTKWCFHVIASYTDPRMPPSQYEREAGAAGPFRHNCIGSACMAWRWAGEAPSPRVGSADFAIGIMGAEEQRAEVYARIAAKRPGYCGLAGAA